MDPTSEQLRQLVIPLFAITKGAVWHALGTAFVVSASGRHALLVTAGHNIEYFRTLVFGPRREHPSLPHFLWAIPPSKVELDGAEIVALVRKRGRTELATLNATSQVLGLDLALLSVSLPEESDCGFERAFALDSTPTMPIGLPLIACGYSGLTARSEQNWESSDFTAEANEGSLVMRKGKVLTNVQVGGTNRFTGIYVSASFDSGMSGGPLVELRNEEPFVRAVISSDLSIDRANHAAGSGVRAFASAIWMLAGLRAYGCKLEHKDQTQESNPFVRDLIAANKIRDVGAAHKYVQVIEEVDGSESRLRELRWIDPGVAQSMPEERLKMSQSTQIYFVAREIIELLLRSQNIREGHWALVLKFSTAVTNIALNGGDSLPTAILQVPEIGLQRVDAAGPGSVDAALVNPSIPGSDEQ